VAGNAVRSLWAEPRAPQPPARFWRDWALVAAFVTLAVVENLLRPDLLWLPVGVVEAVALAFTLLWRRTHPLAMVALAFGVSTVVNIASYAGHAGGQVGLYSMVYLLLLTYAVFRWGSGREAVAGSAIVLATFSTR
jgi:hypothetical protein